MGRRPATPEEARALANPLRLRILRLCLDEALTNKEIAGRLGRDPGSTLHHVRMLVDTGFLVAEDVRRGRRGALEKPYRSTGKSWEVSVQEAEVEAGTQSAMVEAFREELVEAGPERTLFLTRFVARLGEAAYADLHGRVDSLVEEYANRDDGRDGLRVAFLLGGHVRDDDLPAWALSAVARDADAAATSSGGGRGRGARASGRGGGRGAGASGRGGSAARGR